MTTVLTFLLIFSVIVIIHEFGHFYFAKRAGIRVREFAIGMGPKLFSKQGSDGTAYTLRMLPLGGYVRMAGVNEEEEIQAGMQVGLEFGLDDQVVTINLQNQSDGNPLPVRVDYVDLLDEMVIEGYPQNSDDLIRYQVSDHAQIIEADGTIVQVAPRSTRYESASVGHKLMTNFAGPMNNFILSVITFMVVGLLLPGIPSGSNVIGEVIEDSPAQVVGLVAGDQILSINGVEVETWSDVQGEILPHPNQELDLMVRRGGEQKSLTVKTRSVTQEQTGQEYGQIGITQSLSKDLFSRIKYGFTTTWAIMTSIVIAIYRLIFVNFDLNMLGGPVAMAQMTNQVVQFGWLSVLELLGMLSANIGMLNLFPIPALDGGKILSNLIELVRGKPISQEKEGIISLIGVILLLILMVLVTWNDISRLFN
ncbi:RIP metalloprotease RseP [Hutsoniella sourekii]